MDELTFTILWLIIVLVIFIIQFRGWWLTYRQLEELLMKYYEQKGLEVLSISKLKAYERVKYGVPMSPFISFYYSTFSLFRIKKKTICRSVETKNETGTEHIRYVEISFTGAGQISVNEFDVFEF